MAYASTLGGARLGQYRLAQTVSGLFIPASLTGALSVVATADADRWGVGAVNASFAFDATVTAGLIKRLAMTGTMAITASVAAERQAIAAVDAIASITTSISGARAASARIEASFSVDGTITAMFHSFGNSTERRIVLARRPRQLAIARQVRGTWLPAAARRQTQPQEDRTQWAA